MRTSRYAELSIRVEDDRGRPVAWESGKTLPAGCKIAIEARQYRAAIATDGYVSGVAAGSFVDRKTGARDLGFGLDIVDFLLEPAEKDRPIPPGQYKFGDKIHGNIPKRYVEGPQICTQAKRLAATVSRGDGFAAVRVSYRWHDAYPPHPKAGSTWEQLLIFPDDGRFFLAADRVTTVSESPALAMRLDMPGHIRRDGGRRFQHIYLSYHDPKVLPATDLDADFAPDERFLYRRGAGALPERFIRAYQVVLENSDKPGPWLAGMTLEPGDVAEAWCHSRGYVCLIEEIGGRPTRPGDTFGAAYLLGWFDDPDAMAKAYDRHRGASGFALEGPAETPTGYRAVKRGELRAVRE
jgi:hypothetical protein